MCHKLSDRDPTKQRKQPKFNVLKRRKPKDVEVNESRFLNIFLSLFSVKDEPSETDNLTNQLASDFNKPDFKSEFKAEDIKNFDENLLGSGGNGENLHVLSHAENSILYPDFFINSDRCQTSQKSTD